MVSFETKSLKVIFKCFFSATINSNADRRRLLEQKRLQAYYLKYLPNMTCLTCPLKIQAFLICQEQQDSNFMTCRLSRQLKLQKQVPECNEDCILTCSPFHAPSVLVFLKLCFQLKREDNRLQCNSV